MRRRDRRWMTAFGSFVSSIGATRLRDELAKRGLRTHATTPYSWLSGATTPGPARTMAIVEISRGRVSAEEILRHRMEVRDGDHPRQRPVAGRA